MLCRTGIVSLAVVISAKPIFMDCLYAVFTIGLWRTLSQNSTTQKNIRLLRPLITWRHSIIYSCVMCTGVIYKHIYYNVGFGAPYATDKRFGCIVQSAPKTVRYCIFCGYFIPVAYGRE